MLSELAFGFVAVGIATVVLGIQKKSEGWLLLVLWAGVVIAIETALAVAVDSVEQLSLLSDAAAAVEPTAIDQAELVSLQALGTSAESNEPTTLQWASATVIGAALAATSAFLIIRES